MTDAEQAQRIVNQVGLLNVYLQAAHEEGIDVTLEIHTTTEPGESYGLEQLGVTVSRRIDRTTPL